MTKETKIIVSAQRCLRILKYMAHIDEKISLNDLSKAMDMNKSSMHHYLATLVMEGFVIQDPESKNYGIGPEAFRVGEGYLRRDFPYKEMSKLLKKLYRKIAYSCYYFLHTDMTVSCILGKEDNSKDTIHLNKGTTLPLHASASGKIFLAYMAKTERDKLIASTGLPAYTDKTITDIKLMEKEMIKVRLQGYALSDGEYGDFREIAVPVVGFEDKIVGAISVIAYIEKISDKEIIKIIEVLTNYGKHMSDLVHNVVL